jgi:hypothetical protein
MLFLVSERFLTSLKKCKRKEFQPGPTSSKSPRAKSFPTFRAVVKKCDQRALCAEGGA